MRSLKESEGNTGEHTEGLKTLDESAIEDTALVNTVDERLANLKSLERGIDESEASEDNDDTSTPAVPEDELEEENEQAAVESESDDDLGVEDGKGSKDEPVNIPEAYVRAAIHQGWKQEDVDDLVKQNPELALRSLTSCYNSAISANKEFSALGRIEIDRRRAAAETQTVEQVPPSITPAEKEKLIADYGDDPVVARLIANAEKQVAKPQTQQVQQPADLYNTATAHANASANASTDARVNTFFSASVMSPYKEYYGELGLSQSVNDLTNGQREHRLAVLEEGECIMTGLRMRGINATIEEVLEKAHLIVTEPIREMVIRNNLKKTAIDRKNSQTLRPAKSKKTAVSTGDQRKPRNQQELVTKVGQKLANVFGNG